MSKKTPVAAKNDVVADPAFTIPEFARAMRVSPAFVYDEIARGKLFAVKIGRRSIVLGGEKKRYESALEPLISRAAKPANPPSA